MRRHPLLLATALAVLLPVALPVALPEARADRLGGNFRGPGDTSPLREDLPTAFAPLAEDPFLAPYEDTLPFRKGLDAGRTEAAFRGLPLLVYLVLPGSDRCSDLAEAVFRDVEVRDLAAGYVPVLVDAERNERFGISHRVRTFPTLLLLDAEGREAGRAEGNLDAARTASVLRDGLRKAGPPRPTPEAVELAKASDRLARALAKKDWKSVIALSAAILEIGHEGPEWEAAHRARREAALEASDRIEEARTRVRDGDVSRARREWTRVAREFEGLPEAGEATAFLEGVHGRRPSTAGLRGGIRPLAGPDTTVTDSRPTVKPYGDAPAATVLTAVDPRDAEPPVVPEDPISVIEESSVIDMEDG